MASKKYTTYLEEQLIKDIKKAAVDEDTTVAQILTELIKEYLEKRNVNKIK